MKTPTIFLFAILFVLASFSPPAKGYTYSSVKGKLSATFPGIYLSEETAGESYVTTQATATVDEQSYMVSFTIHETDLSQQDGLEEISAEAFANAIGGEIQAKDVYKSKGSKDGLIVKMYNPENDAFVHYIVLFNDNIQYQFASYAVGDAWSEKKAKAFFKTIKLQ